MICFSRATSTFSECRSAERSYISPDISPTGRLLAYIVRRHDDDARLGLPAGHRHFRPGVQESVIYPDVAGRLAMSPGRPTGEVAGSWWWIGRFTACNRMAAPNSLSLTDHGPGGADSRRAGRRMARKSATSDRFHLPRPESSANDHECRRLKQTAREPISGAMPDKWLLGVEASTATLCCSACAARKTPRRSSRCPGRASRSSRPAWLRSRAS